MTTTPEPDSDQEFQTATELITRAFDVLPPTAWDYITGASESETAKQRNRDAIDSYAFRARVLRNVETIDMTRTLLGTPLRIPVLFASMGSMDTFVEGGAAPAVRAATAFGTLPIVSAVSAPGIEGSAAASLGDKWYQLYVRGDKDWIADVVRRVVSSGYKALVVTVDTAHHSVRDRQLIARWDTPSKGRGSPGVDLRARLDWDVVKHIRDLSGLPVVLKGVQCPEDAELAVMHGMAAVYVSNHGGRQLDHAEGTLDVMSDVVTAVGGKVPVLVDGGFCRGSDVVKAIALGATAVSIGRLQAYALAADGERGATRLLHILEREMEATMALLGVTSLAALDRTYVKRVALPRNARPFPHLPERVRW